ncbi:MAG: ABC transporter permease [Ignavibacteria bacterium]|nr:ABC transporter permease [Ignavibacteria bacterium]MCU7504967.1 ABC transporter permease [Ignavibacteria bacterium]MCU7514899.1 ABC transporter permease [Ignavibacteria bacterium]
MRNNYQILNIALRQLTSRKRQTLLTISGIGVGVMVLISAVSLMDGLLSSFIDKIVNIAPHVVVSGERMYSLVSDTLFEAEKGTAVNLIKNVERQDEEMIKNFKRVETLIKSDPQVSVTSPVVNVTVIAKFGTISQPLEIFGIDPDRQDEIVKFSSNMISGRFSELEKTPDGLMLGTTAAKDFGLRLGDKLQFVSNLGKTFQVKVVGIYSTGINDIDNNAYVNLRVAQNIAGYRPDEVSQIYLRVNDLKQDYAVARTIEKETNYKSKTWEEISSSVIALYKMISMMVYFLVFFVILVAGFGVANVLITNVLEKYRDIAILKSIGYKKKEITVIYILQGTLVALIGAAIGCLLGYVLIIIMSSIQITPSESNTSMRSDRLQMGKSPWYFVLASLFALVVSLVASIGPARGAARVNPVEILRGER